MTANVKDDKERMVKGRRALYYGGIGTISWVDSACGEQGWCR